jgi:HTH-type transcriptional regulator / antitoxin HipB
MRQLVTHPAQVGEIFRGRRKARRVSQAALAAKLGISQERLSRLETAPAALTLERLLAIANLLGLDVVLQEKARSAPKAQW